MKRFMLLFVAGIVIVGIFLGVLYGASLNPLYAPPKINQQNGMYLPRKDGSNSNLFLVDSHLYYGVYEQSVTRIGGPQGWWSVQAWDPCIIINGTIRNDYDQDYYHLIGAEVVNADGDEVGPILSQSAPTNGYTVVFAKKDAMSVFDLRIPYNTTDITEYKLLVQYPPTEIPPP